MAEPYWQMNKRRCAIGMASESTTPGTNAYASISAALQMFAYDAVVKTEDVYAGGERAPIGQYGGPATKFVTSKASTLTFRQELAPSDAFLSTLLYAGWQNAAGTRKPVHAPASQIQASIKAWQDGRLKRLYGAAADLVLDFEVGKPAVANWTFKGVHSDLDTDASVVSDNWPSALPFPVRGATLTVDSATPPRWKRSQIKFNNQLVALPKYSDAAAIAYYAVMDRRIEWTFDFEARKKADLDAYGLLTTETEVPVVLTLTRGANTIVFTAPKAQRVAIEEGERDGVLIDSVTFQCNKDSGDDELKITVT